MSQYILIVDDEPEITRLFETALKPLGFDIVAVYDGDEALAQIEMEKPALILLDLMMPRLPGAALLAELRSRPDTQHIPVVIISAYAHDHDAPDLSGATKIMTKGSFGTPEIREVVTAMLAA